MTKEQKLRELKNRALALTGTIQGAILTDHWGLVFAAEVELRCILNEVRLLIEPEAWREPVIKSDQAAMLCPVGEDRNGESH